MTLFLCGDLMPGRGLDQVLPHSVDPELHEPFVVDARRYVDLAIEASGPIEAPVPYADVWGPALAELERVEPAARIVNLETAVTTHGAWDRQKRIHYRTHPANVELLRVARIDACVLANNHVLDWGRPGLLETLARLHRAGMATAGAGPDRDAAAAPAVIGTRAGRLLVFSYGTADAGIPGDWRAASNRPGVNLLPEVSDRQAQRVAAEVHAHREPADRVVVSLHWGPNWGYEVPAAQRRFAHRLVDERAADVVHGHSSHHPKGIEVYRDRLVLYGAGDFLNDYEGIAGHEAHRPRLALMYFPVLDPDGRLTACALTPLRIRRLRLERASADDGRWLAERLGREGRGLGTSLRSGSDGRWHLTWR
jgi:poly-gamma-glutamate capsule biosynthesis protein CapA/YwtB (metallophosphatase superfamily)